MEQHPGFVT
jgi:hypothetical protein